MTNILETLKSSNDTQRQKILETFRSESLALSPEFEHAMNAILFERSERKRIRQEQEKNDPSLKSRNDIRLRAVNETIQNGEPAIYGPSSIFIPGTEKLVVEEDAYDFEKFHDKSYIDLIENFFVWMYPDVTMFIHRESFLTDFYNSKDDIKVFVTYCGEELIYALCCMGSVQTNNENTLNDPTKKNSDHFYHLSRDIIFEKLRKDSYSSIVMIQSLLTLSLYDLGRGNNSSAWLLSGIAIRLGEHKGLSHEPLEWKFESGDSVLSDYDIRVRSRIYWGCYLAEHFIANVLGRMSILNSKQTTIRDTDDLPMLPGIDQFCYKDPSDSNYNVRIDVSMHLTLLDEMYRICETYKPLIFSKPCDDITQLLHQLKEFTNIITDWRSQLPAEIQWDTKVLENQGHNHVLMNIRNQYFLAVLSFHRPFITDTNFNSYILFSLEICMEIISDIETSIISFQKKRRITKCSLVTVYNVILSIMIIMMMTNLPYLEKENKFQKNLDILNFFISLLKDMSSTWSIAGKYHQSIIKTYTVFVKQFMQNRENLAEVNHSQQNLLFSPALSAKEIKELPLNFENEIFTAEEITNIFQSILVDMRNFDESGFVGLDFVSEE